MPIDDYRDNLAKIILHPQIAAHSAKVVLVAPPPINEYLQWNSDQSKGLKTLSRRAATTKNYADAAVQAAKDLGVPVINLWEAFMSKTGLDSGNWKEGDGIPGSMDVEPNDILAELMYDGVLFPV